MGFYEIVEFMRRTALVVCGAGFVDIEFVQWRYNAKVELFSRDGTGRVMRSLLLSTRGRGIQILHLVVLVFWGVRMNLFAYMSLNVECRW